jgi:carnitine-CoA ligase
VTETPSRLDEAGSVGTPRPVRWPDDFPPTWSAVPARPILELLRPALVAGRNPFLYFEDGAELEGPAFLELLECFAGALNADIEVGDRVLLACSNRCEYLVAYFGIIAVRGSVVPVSPDIGPEDLHHVIEGAHCTVAIVEPAASSTLDTVMSRCPSLRKVITIGQDEPHGLSHTYSDGSRLDLTQMHADVSDIIDIGFTSGTTGLPKALAGAHDEMLRYVDVTLRARRPDPDERVLVALQFHYGDPLVAILAAILTDTAVIAMRRFSVSRFWEVARRYQATQIVTIGSIPNLLLTAAPSPAERDHKIRGAISVGIPRDQHAVLESRFGFPWYEVYGSTESGPAIAMPREEAPKYVGTGALGIPYPDLNARLVDSSGAVVLGPGEGELELSGEIVFRGYEGNAEATAEVLHDGWLRSGDLMRRDERGVYYFAGRRKELIRRGGENVAPAEVEATLRLHPSVIDAAVVPVVDAVQGEEVKAYVQVRAGDPVSAAELADHCATNLAPFKVPRYIEVRTQDFPRTPSQRIVKSALTVNGQHDVTSAWDRGATRPN